MNDKFFLKSKGIIGGLMVIVGFAVQIANLYGFHIPAVTADLEKALVTTAEGLGGLLAIYGRIVAEGNIRFK